MRNVICAMNLSIDGCYDHTKLNGDEELHEYFAKLMEDVDLSVSGRKMYELMSPYWNEVARTQSGPAATNKFADRYANTKGIVFSTTMEQTADGPLILRGNLEEEILKLKAMPGKKISIGGISLRSQLIALGLIDEFYFVIQPALVGSGPKFLESIAMDTPIKLKLNEATVMQSGCIGLHYYKS